MGGINRDDGVAGAFEELPTSIFLLSSLCSQPNLLFRLCLGDPVASGLTLQKKNIQQTRKLGLTCSLGTTDDAIAGAFEELPTLFVVLVAISLFSVSVAHGVSTWGESDDFINLQENCLAFAEMVRASDTLCTQGKAGLFEIEKLRNISESGFAEEFNSTNLGMEYSVSVFCADPESGNITLSVSISSSENLKGCDTATFTTCVNVDDHGRIAGARLAVSVWRNE